MDGYVLDSILQSRPGIMQYQELKPEYLSLQPQTAQPTEMFSYDALKRENVSTENFDEFLQVSIKEDYVEPEASAARPKRGRAGSNQQYGTCKFACDQCPKVFGSKGNLIVHRRTHTHEKPYVCSECGKSFSAKGNLNTHVLSHSEFRPFACERCGKGFTTKGNLNVHLRSHNNEKPYSCDVCSKRFTTKGNLVTHGMTHRAEKPFKCVACDKQFSTNGNLVIHTRTHTQDKPFTCAACRKSFYSKGALNTHLKARHSVNTGKTGRAEI